MNVTDINNPAPKKAPQALDSIFPALVSAMAAANTGLAALSVDELKAADRQLDHATCERHEFETVAFLRIEVAKHLARLLAKTADEFEVVLFVKEEKWTVIVWAPGGQISEVSYPNHEVAKSAAEALFAFLSLRGSCDYNYSAPPHTPIFSRQPDCEGLPF